MIPLGVYIPGESKPLPNPVTLTADGVNTVWLNHCLDSTALSVPDTLSFAHACAASGIELVAAPSALDIHGPAQAWKQQPAYWEPAIAETLEKWGTTPKPLAWGIGDEPTEDAVYRDYVASWRRLASLDRVTCTVTRGFVDPFLPIGFYPLTHNVYPFFLPGGGGYPDGPIAAWLTTCEANAAGYAIGQGFSKPGTWATPTPAEVSWQIYSAIACGCRGVFMFCHSAQPGPENLTTLAQLPQQFAAMSAAYKRIATWSALESAAYSTWQPLAGPSGSGCANFTAPNGTRYVMVVCGPSMPATLRVPVYGWMLRDAFGWNLVFRGTTNVTLSAGEGRFFQVL